MAQAYRAELIKRIENSTCLDEYPKGYADILNIEPIEKIFKDCVIDGKIK
jgi:hypothetical protein